MRLDKNSTPIVKLIGLIVILIASFVVTSILGGIYYFFTEDKVLLLTFFTVICFGLSIFIYQKIFDKVLIDKSLFALPKFWWLLIAILMFFLSIPIMESVSDSKPDRFMLGFCQNVNSLQIVGLVFAVAVFPAVFEEWFFRGIMQKNLVKLVHNDYIALVLTAVIFSLVHFDMSNFVARFIIGLLLGLLFYYSKSLIAGILVHFINNLLALLSYLLSSEEELFHPEKIFDNSIYVILSVIIFVVFILLSERYRRKTFSAQENKELEDNDF